MEFLNLSKKEKEIILSFYPIGIDFMSKEIENNLFLRLPAYLKNKKYIFERYTDIPIKDYRVYLENNPILGIHYKHSDVRIGEYRLRFVGSNDVRINNRRYHLSKNLSRKPCLLSFNLS